MASRATAWLPRHVRGMNYNAGSMCCFGASERLRRKAPQASRVCTHSRRICRATRAASCLPAARAMSTGCAIANVRVHDVPLVLATEEAVRPYGNVFSDWDREECRLVRWPQPGWRPVADGLGGGVTCGDFVLEWRDGAHFARNSGVADGDYCFAWTSAAAACDAAAVASTGFDLFNAATDTNKASGAQARANTAGDGHTDGSPSAFLFTEINYHACGSQLFFTDDAPVIVMAARVPDERAPDDVQPEDFVAFWCPPGIGMNVDAMVWHSPPIATVASALSAAQATEKLQTKRVVMRTKQGRVHSKVYYDPLAEAGTLLRVPLEL